MKMRRILLKTKAFVKRPSTIAVFGCLVFLVAVIMGIKAPNPDNTTVGIVTNESECAEKIAKELINREGAFSFVIFENPEELQEKVKVGNIECGFVFDEDFDDIMENSPSKNKIRYIYSAYTTKGQVAKEVLYSEFLKIYGERILRENFVDTTEGCDSSVSAYLLKANEEYANSSDIFTIEFR